ncbi:outer membrane protein [Arenicella chitinivorans]|nr:porin [Arenicella chitinivorans]
MKSIKLAGAASALSILFSNPTFADSGFYIGSHVSNFTVGHSLDRDTGTNTTPSILTLAEESDFGLGLNLGYKQQLNEKLYLAGELFYTDQDIQTNNVNNLLRTQLTVNESYGAKIKLGFDITDDFSMYGLIGSTTLDFDIRNSYPFAPPVRQASEDVSEFTFGLGAEYAVTGRFSVTAEYAQFNDAEFDPIPEVAVPGKINANELDFSGFTFGLNYRF